MGAIGNDSYSIKLATAKYQQKIGELLASLASLIRDDL